MTRSIFDPILIELRRNFRADHRPNAFTEEAPPAEETCGRVQAPLISDINLVDRLVNIV